MTTTTAYEEIRRSALDEIDTRQVDPDENPVGAREIVGEAVAGYQARAHHGGTGVRTLQDPVEMADRVWRSINAWGPLTELLQRHEVEEVFIEGERITYINGRGSLMTLPHPATAEEARNLVERLLATTDRHLDITNPIVQARVLDGTARLTAVIPPVSDEVSATIRRYALRFESLSHLVELGTLTAEAAGFLKTVMAATSSLLISGPPGAGKTSLLAALLDSSPPMHCIRCVEEVRELQVALGPHSSFYEARPAGLDGTGEIGLRALVKLVLGMRPDRIVVGEVRGAEAFELTRAANAGCGFCCTVHANSARDSLEAVVNAALMAGENVTEAVVSRVFAASIDFVVHVDRGALTTEGDGVHRQVTEIVAVGPSLTDGFTTESIFQAERLGCPPEWTGQLPPSGVLARLDQVSPTGTIRDVCDGSVRLF